MSEQEQSLTVIQNPTAPVAGATATVWNTPALMREAFQMAQMLSESDIIPQAYRQRPGNCVIAIDVASRMGIPLLMVMQNIHVIQGKPTWSGSACKAMVDGCGRFKNSRYEFTGREGADDYGCRLVAERVSTGETVRGELITIATAKKEGWYSRNGSKWQSMPGQMLRYRAAAFFARAECSEFMMGLQTTDEVADTRSASPDAPEPEAVVCENCGQTITPTEREPDVKKIIAYGQKRWQKSLCADCQRKRRQKPAEPPADAPTVTDEWNAAPETEAQQGEDTAQMSVL